MSTAKPVGFFFVMRAFEKAGFRYFATSEKRNGEKIVGTHYFSDNLSENTKTELKEALGPQVEFESGHAQYAPELKRRGL